MVLIIISSFDDPIKYTLSMFVRLYTFHPRQVTNSDNDYDIVDQPFMNLYAQIGVASIMKRFSEIKFSFTKQVECNQRRCQLKATYLW